MYTIALLLKTKVHAHLALLMFVEIVYVFTEQTEQRPVDPSETAAAAFAAATH